MEDTWQRKGEGMICRSHVHSRHRLNMKEDEASERSGHSVCTQLMMSNTMSAEVDVEAQRRKP